MPVRWEKEMHAGKKEDSDVGVCVGSSSVNKDENKEGGRVLGENELAVGTVGRSFQLTSDDVGLKEGIWKYGWGLL